MTPLMIINKLETEKCFAPDGHLGIFPAWLKFSHIVLLCEQGLLVRVAGSPANYNHTEYYRATEFPMVAGEGAPQYTFAIENEAQLALF